VIAVSDSNTFPLTVMSVSFANPIRSSTLIPRYKEEVSLEAPNLNDFETVALSNALADFNDLDRSVDISSE
jgi:hypothetical protein